MIAMPANVLVLNGHPERYVGLAPVRHTLIGGFGDISHASSCSSLAKPGRCPEGAEGS